MNFYDMLFLPFILESACYHFTLEIFHTFFDEPNFGNNELFFFDFRTQNCSRRKSPRLFEEVSS